MSIITRYLDGESIVSIARSIRRRTTFVNDDTFGVSQSTISDIVLNNTYSGENIMRQFILVALILTAISANAQKISPITQEFGKKIRSEFSLENEGFTPLAVSLEVKSLKVVDGKMTLTDLDAGTHIKLSEWSARIPAKQIHSFNVDARCDTLPCAFVVFAAMAAGHTNEGVAVTAHVGTTMYLCQKQRACRQSFLAQIKSE